VFIVPFSLSLSLYVFLFLFFFTLSAQIRSFGDAQRVGATWQWALGVWNVIKMYLKRSLTVPPVCSAQGRCKR